MSLQHRLYLTSAVVVFLLALYCPTIFIIASEWHVDRATHDTVDDIERSVSDLQYLTSEYFTFRQQRVYEQWYADYVKLEDLLDRLVSQAGVDRAVVADTRRDLRGLGNFFSSGVLLSRRGQGPTSPGAKVAVAHVLLESREITNDAARLADGAHKRLFRDQGNALHLLTWLSLAFLLSGLLTVVIWLRLMHRLSVRIRLLVRGIQFIGRGNLDYRLYEEEDEIGEIARAYNRMVTRLKETTVSLGDLEHEVHDRRKAEAELQEKARLVNLLQSLALISDEASDVDSAYQLSLNRICGYLGARVGHVLEWDSKYGLKSTPVWYAETGAELEVFRSQLSAVRREARDGGIGGHRLPNEAFDYWCFDVAHDPSVEVRQAAKQAALSRGLAIAVRCETKLVGIIEVYHDGPFELSEPFAHALSGISDLLGRVFERAREGRMARMLASIVQGAMEAVLLVGPGGSVVCANPSALDLFGRNPEELIGAPLSDVISETGLAECLGRARAGEKVSGLRCQAKRGGGLTVDIEVEVSPLRAGDGTVSGIAIKAREAVERVGEVAPNETTTDVVLRKAEAERREQESRLRLVLRQMPAMVWSTDASLHVNFSSGALLEAGESSSHGTGKNLYQYFQAKAPEFPLINAHQRALRGESVSFEATWRGRVHTCLVEPFYDNEHSTAGVIGVALDITDRKLAEQSLRHMAADLARSNRELEEFAYVVSHDLQEPLRMVSCYLNLLRQRFGPQLGDSAEFLAYAMDGSARMKQLIGDLLAYSRVGREYQTIEPVDLHNVVGQALRVMRVAVEESSAQVACGRLPTVAGDKGQLVQLFQNLLSNALKFRRGNVSPRIEVIAEEQSEYWLVRVRDNGIGIASEDAERIFCVFQRLHGREEYSGTGVGLAICKKIVERHRGSIWVESTLGKGSCFCMTFPKAPVVSQELSMPMGA